MAASNSHDVANYLLCVAREHGDYLTPLKLQKLMFYADAWHMVTSGDELIPEGFEAWVHGPVLRSVYSRFQHYRWNPITEEVQCPSFAAQLVEFLNELYRVFGRFSAYELEQLTHQEEPWQKARGNLPPDASCTNFIDKELTAAFYAKLAQSQ